MLPANSTFIAERLSALWRNVLAARDTLSPDAYREYKRNIRVQAELNRLAIDDEELRNVN